MALILTPAMLISHYLHYLNKKDLHVKYGTGQLGQLCPCYMPNVCNYLCAGAYLSGNY